jgi:hypothetical protein
MPQVLGQILDHLRDDPGRDERRLPDRLVVVAVPDM